MALHVRNVRPGKLPSGCSQGQKEEAAGWRGPSRGSQGMRPRREREHAQCRQSPGELRPGLWQGPESSTGPGTPRGTQARRAAHTFQSHTCTHLVEKHEPGQRHSSYTLSVTQQMLTELLLHARQCVGTSTGFKSPSRSGRLEACGGHVWVVIIIWGDATGTEQARHPGTLEDLQCRAKSHSIKDCPPHTQWRNLTLSQGHGHEDAEWPLPSWSWPEGWQWQGLVYSAWDASDERELGTFRRWTKKARGSERTSPKKCHLFPPHLQFVPRAEIGTKMGKYQTVSST